MHQAVKSSQVQHEKFICLIDAPEGAKASEGSVMPSRQMPSRQMPPRQMPQEMGEGEQMDRQGPRGWGIGRADLELDTVWYKGLYSR